MRNIWAIGFLLSCVCLVSNCKCAFTCTDIKVADPVVCSVSNCKCAFTCADIKVADPVVCLVSNCKCAFTCTDKSCGPGCVFSF